MGKGGTVEGEVERRGGGVQGEVEWRGRWRVKINLLCGTNRTQTVS